MPVPNPVSIPVPKLVLSIPAVVLCGCGVLSSSQALDLSADGYDAGFLAVMSEGPAITPVSGSATYSGAIELTAPGGRGDIRGQLELTADFDAATPFSATASGFQGTIDGQDVTYSGTLSSDAASDATPRNEVIITDLPEIASSGEATAMVLSLGGTLTNDDTGVNNALQTRSWIKGNVYGRRAEDLAGTLRFFVLPDGPSALTGNAQETTVRGTWWVQSD